MMNPMTSSECMEIARTMYRELCEFLHCKDFLTTGLAVFGWRDRRRQSAADLSERSWQNYSSAEALNSLYSSSLNHLLFDVQRVDEDNYIVYRIMRGEGRATRFSFGALSPIDCCMLHPIWNQMEYGSTCSWVTFEEAGDNNEHCVFDYGGKMSKIVFPQPHLYMADALSCLRWENTIVGRHCRSPECTDLKNLLQVPGTT
ncbi:TPA: hypothetical protein N0F65_010306 [Lagenidium giganteum]|uniref:Uncharacterized protein n=1 Tax=Lagenidium giganteum TaxID=4803 RepID=A0AAV2ZAK3_9STRA|nr:TPA: hypothetical protein N0F65_010306 [Lagenidium giganteum]